MSDLSLVMAGVLTTGQPVLEIPLQPVQPQKQVKATSTELPSVSYPDIAPPEFSRQQENLHLHKQEIPASISTIEKLYIESLTHQGITNPEFSSPRFTNPYSERQLECPSNFRYSSVKDDHNSLVSRADKVDKPKIDSQTLPVLHFGDVGDAVRVLQRLLLCNRYAIKVDGNFGVLTEAAIKAFQSQRHIDVDGVVGEVTWRELTG
jgi:peptidoglycan hydrolase-like protein with peptidoglycan-binding domain